MPSSEFKPSFSISFAPSPTPAVPFNRAPTSVNAPSPNPAEGASLSASGMSFKDKLREAAQKVVQEEQKVPAT
jgi:hypothetical protein